MQAFQDDWKFDWLALTIPNGIDGKGSRRLGPDGEREAREAEAHLFTWATLKGLRVLRVGKGSDGYLGAAHLAFDPTASERVATIRAGHTTNMPGLELTGGQGACADLAPLALTDLGAVRVDVCLDVSRPQLMHDMHELMCEIASERGMEPPRIDGSSEKGQTIYMGKDEAIVRVYQKDLERVAKGHLAADQADPDLVRIEVMLRPKGGAKAGMGRTARDEGPGALLGVHLWVRQMMERVAVLTQKAREDQAQMGVTRVRSRPDPRPLRVRAEHGARQYARTFCAAEIADIVKNDWDGDWLKSVVDGSQVIERALARLKDQMLGVVGEVCDRLGVLEVRDTEAEAERARDMLDRWMQENHDATTIAKARLSKAARLAREACGMLAEAA
jgi:hypothetical protein